MPIVSDSSPLIALVRIQRLDLVPAILQSVLIPLAVAREIAPSIPVLPPWVSTQAPTSPPSVLTSRGRLGAGEREAIALALEVGADAILLDDHPARRVAEAAGLNVVGTFACYSKRRGWASLQRFVPTRQTARDVILSQPAAYERLLEIASESE